MVGEQYVIEIQMLLSANKHTALITGGITAHFHS